MQPRRRAPLSPGRAPAPRTKDIVISSNISLNSNRPEDPGIAVYFTLNRQQLCMPCDRYLTPEDNLQAIAKTIEAMRGIERWGAKNMILRAFSGFKSLPPPGGSPEQIDWRNTLLLSPGATIEDAKEAYRRLAKDRHPDQGDMTRLNAALDAAKTEFGK